MEQEHTKIARFILKPVDDELLREQEGDTNSW